MSWQAVLGFEIHIELGTKSKMFCGCPADHFGKTPNTQTCPVCLGLPGALPVPNSKAIEWCLKMGLALNCQVNLKSKFDRKNYFYPDLPKGYQISQYDQPFCTGGYLTLYSGKIIHITRVHMEEDTAKLQHSTIDGQKVTMVDFNRSGVPLVEIVTEPEFDHPDQAVEFLKEIQQIVRTLKISSADMEKGSMRLEANISLRPENQKELPKYKVEIKNVNSFRYIKKAIEYEIERQTRILESNQVPKQETRGFDENRGITFSQRSKEEAHDYRYFPEPDIPPFIFNISQVEEWKSEIPQLPSSKRDTLFTKYHLSAANIQILSANNDLYTLFTHTMEDSVLDPKTVSDFLVNKRYGTKLPKTVKEVVKLIQASKSNSITDQTHVKETVQKVINTNPKAVSDYLSGKEQALFFLIGCVRREIGNVDISDIKQEILEILKTK